jgi:hypothetical protein
VTFNSVWWVAAGVRERARKKSPSAPIVCGGGYIHVIWGGGYMHHHEGRRTEESHCSEDTCMAYEEEDTCMPISYSGHK